MIIEIILIEPRSEEHTGQNKVDAYWGCHVLNGVQGIIPNLNTDVAIGAREADPETFELFCKNLEFAKGTHLLVNTGDGYREIIQCDCVTTLKRSALLDKVMIEALGQDWSQWSFCPWCGRSK